VLYCPGRQQLNAALGLPLSAHADIDALVERIRAAFPDVVSLVDAKLQDIYGGGPEASEAWVFAFQYVTKDAARAKDTQQVKEHLSLMDGCYQTGSDAVRSCIEGKYVQHLLAGLTGAEKSWAWSLFPRDFRSFYVAICGEPGSVRFENA